MPNLIFTHLKDCPPSHPVKIPEIQLFFRISPYDGGHHEFSDNTGNYHADYFSGWDEEFLQSVLDNCNNYSEAAMPDAFCEEFLTFRDGKQPSGCRRSKIDEDIVSSLECLQPNPSVDTSTITDEAIDNIASLPRGVCEGNLFPLGTVVRKLRHKNSGKILHRILKCGKLKFQN